MLQPADINAALGLDVSDGEAISSSECQFDDLFRTYVRSGSAATFADERSSDGGDDVTGVADEAYFVRDGDQQELQARRGDLLVGVYSFGTDSDVQAALADLATTVFDGIPPGTPLAGE